MGCDIHAYLEAKLYNDDDYTTVAHLYIERDYQLFSILANVRNYAEYDCCIPYVCLPKGLPSKIGYWTEVGYSDYDHGHSESWLNYDEIKKALKIAEKLPEKWCFNRLKTIADFMETLSESRLVFWFDN